MVSALPLAILLSLAAAETDPYYHWIAPVPDGTRQLNARLNRDFADRLAEVNRTADPSLTCHDVASRMLGPYWTTGFWFVIGSMKDWGFPYRPAHATERTERFLPTSIYSKYGLLPLGLFVPVDPTVRVGDVTFGTDKISHFLNNSWRYWETYRAARERGESEERAVLAAIDRGIAQEAGILGSGVASSFSYADLEVNYQGLEMIRDWCERGELAHEGDRWFLRTSFDISRYVNPCWDEGWYANAFQGLTGEGVKDVLRTKCSLRHRPHVQAQRAAYRSAVCTSFNVRVLDERVAAKELPDPEPFTIEAVCGDSPGRIRPGAYDQGHAQGNTTPLPRTRSSHGSGPVGACWPRHGPRHRRERGRRRPRTHGGAGGRARVLPRRRGR